MMMHYCNNLETRTGLVFRLGDLLDVVLDFLDGFLEGGFGFDGVVDAPEEGVEQEGLI